jgi:hypothetical protein
MCVVRGAHFYVDELAQLHGGKLVIPQMWIVRQGVLCADALEVISTEVSLS